MKKSLLFVLMAMLLLASSAVGDTAYRYSDSVSNIRGDVIGGATVTVYLANTTTKATLYTCPSTGAGEMSNPTYSDTYGRFHFYSTPGLYDVVISGTGITSYTDEDVRVWSETTEGIYNVIDYGAIPDDGVDDSGAIQGAVDAVGVIGFGTVYLPAGAYNLEDRVNIPEGTDITISGQHAVLDGGGSVDQGFHIDAGNPDPAVHGSLRFTGIEMTGFTKWCIAASTDVSLVFSTIERIEIDGCNFHDAGGGVQIYALMESAEIHGCTFSSILRDASNSGGTQAIRLGSGEDEDEGLTGHYLVHDNVIDGVTNDNAGAEAQGILVYGSFASIHNNMISDVENTSDGTNSEGIYTKCRYAIVEGNSLHDAGTSANGMICSKGAGRDGATTSPAGYGAKIIGNTIVSEATEAYNLTVNGIFTAVEEVQIENNRIEGIRKYAIATDNDHVGSCVISGNTIVENRGGVPVAIQSSGTGLVVKNNYISNFGVGVAGEVTDSAFGVYVRNVDGTNDLFDVAISDNVIIDDGNTQSSNHVRGICVLTAGNDITGLMIHDNMIRFNDASNTERGIYIYSTDAINDISVYDNLINVSDDKITIIPGSGTSLSGSEQKLHQTWSLPTTSAPSPAYIGGFYDFESSSNDFLPAVNFGIADVPAAAHFMIVTGALTIDEVTITITGDRITDSSPVETGYVDTIVIPSGTPVDSYFETSSKWLGVISIETTAGSEVPCDYGWCKYWDNGNTDFTVVGGESVWMGDNTSTIDIILYHHKTTGWTYTGSGPTPPTPLFKMSDSYGTNVKTDSNDYGCFKRADGDYLIQGSASEGVIVGFTFTTSACIEYGQITLEYTQ